MPLIEAESTQAKEVGLCADLLKEALLFIRCIAGLGAKKNRHILQRVYFFIELFFYKINNQTLLAGLVFLLRQIYSDHPNSFYHPCPIRKVCRLGWRCCC
jgi:hypothetical protein